MIGEKFDKSFITNNLINIICDMNIKELSGLYLILNEWNKVKTKYPDNFVGHRHCLGVLRTETIEYELAVTMHENDVKIMNELKQVAQICLRGIVECCLINDSILRGVI